jgi:hypothetical protein
MRGGIQRFLAGAPWLPSRSQRRNSAIKAPRRQVGRRARFITDQQFPASKVKAKAEGKFVPSVRGTVGLRES